MDPKFSRTCVGCEKVSDKGSLIRIVRDKTGLIRLDEKGRMEGRGAYLCPSNECFEKAVKRHALERSFKCPVPKEALESIGVYIKEHTT